MKKKTFTVCGMPYEEYQEMKYKMLEKAFMKAHGWKENEYETK